MSRLANILVAARDSGWARDLEATLAGSGYPGEVVDSVEGAVERGGASTPDLVLVTTELADGSALDLVRRLRDAPETANLPALLVVPDTETPATDILLDAGVDDVIHHPFETAALVARMGPLVRLSTMHTELRRRAHAASHFGVVAPEHVDRPTDVQNYHVLTAGADMAERLRPMVGEQGRVITVDSVLAVEPTLDDMDPRELPDAVVLHATDDPVPYLDLCAQVRNNPRLFNMPVLLMADEGLFDDPVEPYRRGASRVVPTGAEPERVRTGVLMLCRRQRLRWRIRDTLAQTHTAKTAAELAPSVFSRNFLDAYVHDCISDARTWNKPLSVVMFYIPNITGIYHSFGKKAGDHILQQMGQWIGGLVRAEDLPVHYQGNEFCVILADTPLNEAEVVMHRIAGVLSYTDFALHDVYQPVSVWVQVGSAALEAGEEADSFIGRARANLD